jgi:hypothetical protein
MRVLGLGSLLPKLLKGLKGGLFAVFARARHLNDYLLPDRPDDERKDTAA